MNDGYTIFVCQKHRPPTEREGCCLARGGPELLAAFEAAVAAAGLEASVAVRPSGCLDHCPDGPAVLVVPGHGRTKAPTGFARLFSRGVAYGRLVPRDAGAIVREHLVGRVPVARCKL